MLKVTFAAAAVASSLVITLVLRVHGWQREALVFAGAAVVVVSAWFVLDGVTDLIAWRKLRTFPCRAMRVSPRGIEFNVNYDGTFPVAVSWSDIDGCAFRPGLDGQVFLCFDAPERYLLPPPGSGCAPEADPQVVRTRAHVWAVLARASAPEWKRDLLVDTYWFGTPFAVNLAICPGVDRTHLMDMVREWSSGRCDLVGSP